MDFLPLSRLRSSALTGLFAEERAQWTSRLNWDYREPQKIIATMVDLETLPGFVAIDEKTPVGYAFYIQEAGRALIGTCFVARRYQQLGIERQLLTETLKELKTNPGIFRIESQFVNFNNWEIDDFFSRNGFVRFERCFMVKNCEGVTMPPRSKGTEISQWLPQDLQEAARLTVNTYAKLVDCQITYHYQTFEDCLDFLSNIVMRPGCGNFIPQASYCARDVGSRELIGYILGSRISPQDGHIPQIAVAPEHQGRGVGTSLLGRTIRFLTLNGYQTVSLSVTASNAAAMALYQRFGFSVHLRFPAFVWLRS
jgi:ribosomal protein S18 acetylase RimI-like enzyme